MVDERKDVEFPLWRKKVDGSLFQHAQTVVPDWVLYHVLESENGLVDVAIVH